jgi:hypothetical protein
MKTYTITLTAFEAGWLSGFLYANKDDISEPGQTVRQKVDEAIWPPEESLVHNPEDGQ